MLHEYKEKRNLQNKEHQRPVELFDFFFCVVEFFCGCGMHLDEQREQVSGVAN